MNNTIGPTLSLSSLLTSHLLQNFRNENGSEENWIYREERKNYFPIYCGKIIVTEIATGILCLVALVESVAYSILIIPSLIIFPISSVPLMTITPLWFSSGFAIHWNAANAFIYNFSCLNLPSHESFARSSMDESHHGKIYRNAIKIFIFALYICSIVNGRAGNDEGVTQLYITIDEHQYLRMQDRLYLSDWANRNFPEGLTEVAESNQLRAYRSAVKGLETTLQIDAGIDFFKKHILGEGQISPLSRKAVVECDPAAYEFVLTRAIFLYAFNSNLQDQLPSFANKKTQEAIQELRKEQHSKKTIKNLQNIVFDLKIFNTQPDGEQEKALFNKLKGIAYCELQGIFVTRCWQTGSSLSIS